MNCPDCHQPLIQIDHYGERWIGCIHCNKWGKPGDSNLVMELSDEDWKALRTVRSQGHGS
jgi:hypothetical protein